MVGCALQENFYRVGDKWSCINVSGPVGAWAPGHCRSARVRSLGVAPLAFGALLTAFTIHQTNVFDTIGYIVAALPKPACFLWIQLTKLNLPSLGVIKSSSACWGRRPRHPKRMTAPVGSWAGCREGAPIISDRG